MGYIDGYKLPNKEQVFPRLPGGDAAGGPTLQSNMVDQRIPIKNSLIYSNPDGSTIVPGGVTGLVYAPSGNNVYIGASNYNRGDGVRTGDWGATCWSI